ncbi:MAG: hypothetical protein QOH62_2691 [Solirubrobacteraceae bacterium]|nr:hypothetical protein [Solirubrobacteraceae bacterium]
MTEGYDEAHDAQGRPRPHYEAVFGLLDDTDVGALRAEVAQRLAREQVSFGDAPFLVDPVPRIMPAAEWKKLAAGLEQRTRALNAFVADAYGDRRMVAAGRIPADVIDGAEGYELDLAGAWPADQVPAGVAGLDVVRAPDGELLVLEDNLRTPSGFTYAVAARAAVGDALPAAALEPADLAGPLFAALDAALRAAAPPGVDDPQAVVLTDSHPNGAAYEHATVARRLGLPLVTAWQLEPHRGGLRVALEDGTRVDVDVVYRRTDEDRVRGDHGRLTAVAELLLAPWLAGRIGLVNGFGAGVGDDKLVHGYVEEMVRFFLGEEPLIRSVPTIGLADAGAAAEVLGDLRSFVVKPRWGFGGQGVVVCAHADDQDLRRLSKRVGERPDRFVAQRTITLSHHPTVVADGVLEPRHVDLRPFVLSTPTDAGVIPGGLTRFAMTRGALVVNSSQKGGGKDTWVTA